MLEATQWNMFQAFCLNLLGIFSVWPNNENVDGNVFLENLQGIMVFFF